MDKKLLKIMNYLAIFLGFVAVAVLLYGIIKALIS